MPVKRLHRIKNRVFVCFTTKILQLRRNEKAKAEIAVNTVVIFYNVLNINILHNQ